MVAVFGLGDILIDKIVRQMTIYARRSGVMACFLPAIVLLAHNVAIHTYLGIIGKIRKPLGIIDSVTAEAKQKAHKADKQ